MIDYVQLQVIAINRKIRKVRAVIDELTENGGTVSASLSSAGNSQSYTRADFDKLFKLLAIYQADKARLLMGRRRTSPNFVWS